MKKLLLLMTLVLGTTLAYSQSIIEGTINDENNTPIIGANILIKNSDNGTTSDIDGFFKIETEVKSPTLVISYVGYETIEIIADKSPLSISLSPQAEFLDDVVIVGSRNPNRSNLQTPVAVDVINLKDIEALSPQTTISDMINYVVPSFNSNRQSASDGTEHIDPASLRGLGPDQVLVLVNGKRRHTTSLINYQNTVGNGSVGTDLSSIPTSAVERIEVLRDGAAAQYGSDAIAGVINIVLKKSEGFTGSLMAGQTSRNDGETVNLNLNYGAKIGEDGYINLSAQIGNRNKTNRSQNHDLIIYDQSAEGNFFAYDFTNDPDASRAIDDNLIAAAGLTRDDFDFQVGDAKITNYQLFGNLGFDLNENISAYAFGGISARQGDGFGFRRLPSEGDNVVLGIYPNGFQPTLASNITDPSFAAGLKGNFNNWNVDLSNTFGANTFAYEVQNTNNASLGTSSPTTFDAGSHSFQQNTINLDVSKFHDHILAGFNIAFGAEYRAERYKITAGERNSYIDGGSQSFQGFTPENSVNATRNNIGLYADFELDITESFLIGLAGRFEDYSDFGNTFNYKLTSRYKPSEVFSLRGAISSGYRAPSLHQQNFSYTSLNISADGSQLATEGIYDTDDQITKAFGMPALKEETSQNYSLGFTLGKIAGFTLTVDAYMIDIEDRVVITSAISGFDAFGGLQNQSIVDLLAANDVSSARFFSNAIDTRTQGLDFVLSYNNKINKTKLGVDLALNLNETTIEGYNFPSTLAGINRDLFFGSDQESLIETNIPKTKATATVNLGFDKLSTMIRGTYFGKVTRDGFPFGGVQEHEGKMVIDLSLSYKITDKISFSAGANNIFDVFPDEQIYENSYFGVFKYAPVQMGTTGAFYFGRLNFNF